jgi:hypothetical protein
MNMKVILIFILFVGTFMSYATTTPADSKGELTPQSQPTSNLREIRDCLEIASFAATITLAVAAIIGLRQLHLARLQLKIASDTFSVAKDALVVAKDDIKIRSRREAIALSAKHCEDFADVALPKLNQWHQELLNKGIVFPANCWELANKNFDETSLKDSKAGQQWVNQIKAKQAGTFPCKILNQLEALAIYFATGAADEEVAFPVLGTLFCKYVEQYAPFLIDLRSHKDASFTSGKYANTIRLFEIWSDRIRLEEIDSQTKKAEKERTSLKSQTIKPIGC